MRDEANVEAAVAIAWPVADGTAQGIVGFLDSPSVELSRLKDRLQSRLPDYMVPREIHILDQFPLNANGKIDRHALVSHLNAAS